ncbi:MAG: Gx transporter family protein [Magnetococcales bacterium]|nr:Gx transporter family protein [Magnetococcales bacterium]
MPRHTHYPPRQERRRALWITYLAAAATVTHLFESTLPGLGPWFKPGLANVFALIALLQWDLGAAVGVTLIRITIGSLTLGTFLTPTFLLSLSGSLAALSAMAFMVRVPIRFGVVGISLAASLAHMSAQVVVAAYVIVGHPALLSILPLFLIGAWITGIGNGYLSALVLERLTWYHSPEDESFGSSHYSNHTPLSKAGTCRNPGARQP